MTKDHQHQTGSTILFYSIGDMVGGAQRSMLELATGLRDLHGYSPVVLTLGLGALRRHCERGRIPTKTLTPLHLKKRESPSRWGSLITKAKKTLALVLALASFSQHALKLRPAVIYLNDAPGILPSLLASKLTHAPIVFHVRAKHRVPFFTALAFRFADRIFFVSEDTKQVLHPSEHHRYKEKNLTIPTGFQSPAPLPDSRASILEALKRYHDINWDTLERPVFLVLGSFDPRKNQTHALHAFKDFRKTTGRGHLVLCGPTTFGYRYLDDLKAETKSYGLQYATTFIEGTDLPHHLLRVTDITIISSFIEGLPRVAIESLRQSTPVISYPVSGIQDIVRNQYCGRITTDFCPSQLATLMIEAHKDQSFWSVNAEHERLRVGQSFDYESYICRFAEELENKFSLPSSRRS